MAAPDFAPTITSANKVAQGEPAIALLFACSSDAAEAVRNRDPPVSR
jgi:hypothetical protein